MFRFKFKFAARLLKEASARDVVLMGHRAHWRRIKNGKLIEIKAGPGTPPKLIETHVGDRLTMGQEAMSKYLETGLDVLGATYIGSIPDWIDFIKGDERMGLHHTVTKRDRLRQLYAEAFPGEENPLSSGVDMLRMIPLVLSHCSKVEDSGGKRIASWDGWRVILEARNPSSVVSAFNGGPVQHAAYLRLTKTHPDLLEN
jgi:hypothetical protein